MPGLEVTDLGYFPRAQGHFRSRNGGCAQHIVLLCLEGTGFLRVQGRKEQRLNAGDVGFVPLGQGHEYGASDDFPWTIQWVHFRGEGFALTGPNRLPDDLFRRARDLFSDLVSLAARQGPTTAVLRGLAWWLELVLHQPGVEDREAPASVRPMETVVRRMADHLDQPLTLDQLAAWAALSPSWFSAQFRQEIGSPPMAHLARLRVQKACGLLERTDLSVSEVARQVGFPDPLHFSRVFRQRTGLSPSQWRLNPRG